MKKLMADLKNKYNLAVGERTIEALEHKLTKISKTKVKVSGRSYETGKKKTVTIPFCELFN